MSQLEGEDSRVSELLYRVVIQVVLLFDQEPWELPDTMMRAVDGTHMGFLSQIAGKQA